MTGLSGLTLLSGFCQQKLRTQIRSVDRVNTEVGEGLLVDGRATDRKTCWLKTRLEFQLSAWSKASLAVVPPTCREIEEQTLETKSGKAPVVERNLDGRPSYAVCWTKL
jgi:hypothetical protein